MATANVMTDNGSRLAIATVPVTRMVSSVAENVPRAAPSLTRRSPASNCTGAASDGVVILTPRRTEVTSSRFGASGALRSMEWMRHSLRSASETASPARCVRRSWPR